MDEQEAVVYETESAFHALGLPDADDLVFQADLMRKTVEIIAERGLPKAEAGELMDMDPPRVSALLNEKIGNFPPTACCAP